MCSMRSELRTNGTRLMRVSRIMHSLASSLLIGGGPVSMRAARDRGADEPLARPPAQQIEDCGELLANGLERRSRIAEQRRLLTQRFAGRSLPSFDAPLARARIQVFSSAFNGVTVVVKQPLDFEYQLHVFAAVQTMPLAGLLGSERGELSLPEAQDVRFDSS